MPRGRAPVHPSPRGPSSPLSYLCGLRQSLRTLEGHLPEFSLIEYFPVLGLDLCVSSNFGFQPEFLDPFGCSFVVMPQFLWIGDWTVFS